MESGNGSTPESEPAQTYTIEHDQGNQLPPQNEDWTATIQDLRFVHNGKYVCGYVETSQDLVMLLESYRVISGTAFTSSQNLVQSIKTIDQAQLQMRFVSPASRPRLFWQMNAGEPTIQYDGVPFMSVSHGMDLPCVRFGGRRKKVEQVSLPTGESMPVDYRQKTGCEAKITIRRILRYPCAKYNESVPHGIAAIRRQRKKILDDLVQRIIAGSAKFQERFHFLFPTPMAHNGHPVAEIDGPPPVTQPVMDEILAQLNTKVMSIPVLCEHVKNVLLAAGEGQPLTEPIYFPTEYDIFRQVYWLYKLEQLVTPTENFKGSISGLNVLQGIEKALTTVSRSSDNTHTPLDHSSTHPITTTPTSSDAMTNVYSIIMDDSPGNEGASPLVDQLSDHQMSGAGHEVELNSAGENSSHLSMMEDSSIVNQLQMMNSSPVSVSQPQQGIQLGGSGHVKHSLMISPKVSVARCTSVSRDGFKSNSNSTGADEDDPVSEARSEVQSMLRIIDNQTHACKNLSALNNLRRQLTELCGQFSVYLAGGSSSEFGAPSSKRART